MSVSPEKLQSLKLMREVLFVFADKITAINDKPAKPIQINQLVVGLDKLIAQSSA